MTLFTFKIFAALIILIMTLIGGLWPFLKKSKKEFEFPVGESFAAGIFLGAGLLHMLPDAARDFFNAGYHYPLPFLIAALSFLTLLFLEHLSHAIKTQIALLTLIMLAIHSLLEGAAVGLSTDFITSFMIFIAIIAHKGAASFALSINLNRSKMSSVSTWTGFGIFALMTPLGIFGGEWVNSATQFNALLTPTFTALAAGTFLYIGTLHGLGRASLIKHCCNIKEFIVMFSGFSLMAVVAMWT
jgi:zinc transporter 1/2/3